MSDEYYGITCPIFDMVCLGSEECLHDVPCKDIFWQVRLDDKIRAKKELELLRGRL